MTSTAALFIGGCVVFGALVMAGAIVMLAVQVDIIADTLKKALRRTVS